MHATEPLRGTSPGPNRLKAGLVDTPSQVGGYPIYRTAEAPIDSDGDGMPDAWECDRGLDVSDPADGCGMELSDQYTNIEIYLHMCAAALLEGKRINVN